MNLYIAINGLPCTEVKGYLQRNLAKTSICLSGIVSLANQIFWFEPATEEDIELTELSKDISVSYENYETLKKWLSAKFCDVCM